MAVYTHVPLVSLNQFLHEYEIGSYIEFEGIRSGVSNSNYYLRTTTGKFILTLYESRTPDKDLPFFVGLMEHLAEAGIPCPRPLKGTDGKMIRTLMGHKALIVSFLPGKAILRVMPDDCYKLGQALAQLHNASLAFTKTRANTLGLKGLKDLFEQCRSMSDTVQVGLSSLIEHELHFLYEAWPRELPQGIIHADLFPDNVFFDGERVCGLIDFYFACTDFLAYDVAICLNAWCFESNNMSFNITKARALLKGYQEYRHVPNAEWKYLPILARGAALRFLMTRLYDWLHQVPGALVQPKDPLEYLARLKFHQSIQSSEAYGFMHD